MLKYIVTLFTFACPMLLGSSEALLDSTPFFG